MPAQAYLPVHKEKNIAKLIMKCIKLLKGGAYIYSGSGSSDLPPCTSPCRQRRCPSLFPVVHGELEIRVVSPQYAIVPPSRSNWLCLLVYGILGLEEYSPLSSPYLTRSSALSTAGSPTITTRCTGVDWKVVRWTCWSTILPRRSALASLGPGLVPKFCGTWRRRQRVTCVYTRARAVLSARSSRSAPSASASA